jgi:hypothetical protein
MTITASDLNALQTHQYLSLLAIPDDPLIHFCQTEFDD